MKRRERENDMFKYVMSVYCTAEIYLNDRLSHINFAINNGLRLDVSELFKYTDLFLK